jgi:hypothetical protein
MFMNALSRTSDTVLFLKEVATKLGASYDGDLNYSDQKLIRERLKALLKD